MATEEHQLQFGTSFDQDDREVESLTTPPPPAGISPGITVITAPPEVHEVSGDGRTGEREGQKGGKWPPIKYWMFLLIIIIYKNY